MNTTVMRVVVLGASGPVGRRLCARLLGNPAFCVVAVRRPGRVPVPGIENVSIGISAEDSPRRLAELRPDAIVSAAPLFAVSGLLGELVQRYAIRVVACSSMSAVAKVDSLVPADRHIAALLLAGEAGLVGAQGPVPPLIIRPTMIYGDAATGNVARIQRFARKYGFLPSPSTRGGLRQPLHAEDLAAALVAALRPGGPSGVMELGGGSRLRFAEIIEVIARSEGARIVKVPSSGARLIGRMAGMLRLPGAGALYRLSQDQIADNRCAEAELGVQPRPFRLLREEA